MVGPRRLADRYSIEDRVAAGGMGAVFRATDDRLGRSVAIKILKEELADDERFVERFRREARAAAALTHPNVANVFDYGEDDGRPFIVMELVEGRDLSRVLREEGPIEPERARGVAAGVCGALAHAHAAGLVHRDIKPGNIMLTDGDQVKVTDFGIARAVGESTLTATGNVMGTAHYISPEQAAGSAVGPASDIYSLGIVLYEMLTGAVPFTGDSPISIAMRHVSDPVPPPSELAADVPGDLDDAVARATQKDPDDRYRSADEMAAALRGETIPATEAMAMGGSTAVLTTTDEPTPSTERLILPTRYDPARLGRRVLLIFLLLVLLAGGLLLWRLASAEDQEPPVDPRRSAPASQPPDETEEPEPETPVEPEPEVFTMPPLTGQAEADALALLEAAGLVVTVERETSDEVTEGLVIGSIPPEGTEVTEGAPVTLIVSAGPAEEEEGDGEEEEGDEGNEGEGEGNGPPEDKPDKDKDKEKDKD